MHTEQLQIGDTILIMTDQYLTTRTKQRLIVDAKHVFPKNKVALFDGGLQVKILKGKQNKFQGKLRRLR